MDCPRCAFPNVAGNTCPRCGVIFAKLHTRAARPPRSRTPSRSVAARRPAARASSRSGRPALLLLLLVLALGLAVFYFGLGRTGPLDSPRTVVVAAPTPPSATTLPPVNSASAPPPAPVPTSVPTSAPQNAIADQVLEADLETARRLVDRLNSRGAVAAADVDAAERLLASYPDQGRLEDLLVNVLLAAARQARERRDVDDAAARLRRAAELQPDKAELPAALANLFLESGRWPEAETAARRALELDPDNADAHQALGFALFRQDRNREARNALEDAWALRPDPATRALLDRIAKEMLDEQGMKQQTLSHFNLRYDGEEHEQVGRAILRALDRHYATLVRTFDHQPETTIPVILFTRQAYHDTTDAPLWAGGHYSSTDGRIRVPIGGLTERLTPELDGTLIHEITHAFVADISAQTCPRSIHEGLAQYMEGKRSSAQELEALADGRVGGIRLDYVGGLAFVEYLLGQRGQGGINDLLRAMGETGDEDEAFRRVYGQDHGSTKQRWLGRLRQTHGG
jgi:tetratricopeptide (TPR) repeat protein